MSRAKCGFGSSATPRAPARPPIPLHTPRLPIPLGGRRQAILLPLSQRRVRRRRQGSQRAATPAARLLREQGRGRHPLYGRVPPGRRVTEEPRPRGWLQERLGGQLFGGFLNRNVPEETGLPHTLGSATLFLLVVQVVTGIVLAMNYAPSPE